MKNLISYPKHALSTLLVCFVFLMMAEAQIIADYSQLRRTEGLVLQRLNHDETEVRKSVMNFHTNIPIEDETDAENFDYIYLRATAETDTLNPNNMVLTSKGMLAVGEGDQCRDLDKTIKGFDESLNIKLYVNGSIAVSDGNATNLIVSDERFKKNIKPLKNSLEVIRNSNFVEYQYNDLSGVSSKKKYYGILAQEMEKVLPNTIVKTRKKIRVTDKQSTEFFMFNPNDLIYSGLNAIKELDKENQALKDKVEEEAAKSEALEKRVSELEKMLAALVNGEEINKQVLSQTNVSSVAPRLYQNAPNPLHQSTEIEYYLPDNTSSASIIIQDLNGKTITQFNLQNLGSGKVNFNAKQYGMNTGTYIYSLMIDGLPIETKKMIFVE